MFALVTAADSFKAYLPSAKCTMALFGGENGYYFLQVTQPFILRRTKRDVEKQLTRKYEHVLKCRLSSRQKALYEDVILQPR